MDAISVEVITDLVTNTPFVGFLIWQYVQMRKDYKEQQDKMDALRTESLVREEAVRQRFEKVISNLNDDKDQLVQTIDKRLSTVEGQIKKLFSVLNYIQREMGIVKEKKAKKPDAIITVHDP